MPTYLSLGTNEMNNVGTCEMNVLNVDRANTLSLL